MTETTATMRKSANAVTRSMTSAERAREFRRRRREKLLVLTIELREAEVEATTASYMQEFGVAGWATMNTSGLRNVVLPPPPLAFAVTLLGENDDANGPWQVIPSNCRR